jgi:diketogulonate reductase-like aldo/keto reductase
LARDGGREHAQLRPGDRRLQLRRGRARSGPRPRNRRRGADQVRFNPAAYRKALLNACAERDIALEAYSPLGTGAQLDEPVVTGIADRLGRAPAQVLLRWCVQRGIPIITKSTHRDHIAENAKIFDFELAAPDMEELDALDRSEGTLEAMERKRW